MTAQQLIELLEALPDKELEVVFRVGHNHGANKVCRVTRWNGYKNPGHVKSMNPSDYLLPDNPNYPDGIQLLVLGC